VSTEEDGVDEPTRSTQPSLIMAPPGREVDPDRETEDAVVNNGIMSPARTRSGTSRSAAGQRDGSANGDASAGDVATAAKDAVPAKDEAPAKDQAPAKDATDSGSGTVAPLPADTIGKQKTGATDQAVKADKAEEPAETAAAESPAVKSSLKPSFTPSVSSSSPAPAAPIAPTAAAAASSAGAKPAAAPSSTAQADHAPAPSYSRPDWPAGARSSTAAPAQPAGPGTSSPSQAPSGAGRSSGNGSSPSATSAVTGAAAGLASSVASAWQRRGSNGQRTKTRGTQVRKPARRQAMLTLARVEPWSVMKFSFVASVVAFVILFVAVAVLYMILASLGVFDSLQHTVSSITSSQSSAGTNISHWFSASLILGYTAMLGALNIVLITAMSTVGSVIYNIIAKTIGGIEVTLRETD
jgi:hypothetical protein